LSPNHDDQERGNDAGKNGEGRSNKAEPLHVGNVPSRQLRRQF
jgi:hypothetical protein